MMPVHVCCIYPVVLFVIKTLRLAVSVAVRYDETVVVVGLVVKLAV